MNRQARDEATEAALRLLSRSPLYLDTETTGLGNDAEAVEIAVLNARGGPLFNSLVKPTVPISAEASGVHHITEEMLEAAPAFNEIWEKLSYIIDGRDVAIFNAEYDVRILKQSHLAAFGLIAPQTFLSHCVMKLYAQWYGEIDVRRGTYRWHSLDKAAKQCGITLPNSHRAADDALLARALLHFIAGKEY